MNDIIRKHVVVSVSVLFFIVVSLTTQTKGSCRSDIPGDLNNDCRIDFIDLAIIAQTWLKECGEGVAVGQSCEFDCQCASSCSACIDGECTKLLDYVFVIDATASMANK
jgi:hypothetical protein